MCTQAQIGTGKSLPQYSKFLVSNPLSFGAETKRLSPQATKSGTQFEPC
jgi:hypothetical protein